MFDSNQKPTGTQYTGTVALLVLAVTAPAAALLISPSIGHVLVLMALAMSGACLGLAWLQWKWRSELTIPSIAVQPARTK